MQIVNLSPEAILILAEAASRADAQGRRFRIAFEPETQTFPAEGPLRTPAHVKFKVGEGMWSMPYMDQPDPYRD